MSCDDSCTFKMSVDDPLNEAAKTELLNRETFTTFRNTYVADKSDTSPDLGKVFTEWITLEGGQHYFVEATLGQGVGGLHIDVGMEVVPDVIPAEHPKF